MYDKEIIGYHVLYECNDDGEDMKEFFDNEDEAVNHAKYLLLTAKSFYTNIRVYQIRNVIW